MCVHVLFQNAVIFYFYPASVGNLLAWVLEIYTLTSHGTGYFSFNLVRVNLSMNQLLTVKRTFTNCKFA